jgi:hypothetical protein
MSRTHDTRPKDAYPTCWNMNTYLTEEQRKSDNHESVYILRLRQRPNPNSRSRNENFPEHSHFEKLRCGVEGYPSENPNWAEIRTVWNSVANRLVVQSRDFSRTEERETA